MGIKVSELQGAQLDCWVAKAEGVAVVICEDTGISRLASTYGRYQPTQDWAIGGPIIERERIEIHPRSDCGKGPHWGALPYREPEDWNLFQRGPTPLIAAMRAYVMSKFGEEVPDA